MKQLLNTLFVMTEDAYLALENDNVVIWRSAISHVDFECRMP